jgi:hypothetical protein
VGASPTAEICVDTASTFTVDDIHQQKDCAWLAENKSKFGYSLPVCRCGCSM